MKLHAKARMVPCLALALCCLLCACAGAPQAPSSEEAAPPQSAAETPRPPEQTAAEKEDQIVADLLGSMALEEKVGQLFFVRCPEENA